MSNFEDLSLITEIPPVMMENDFEELVKSLQTNNKHKVFHKNVAVNRLDPLGTPSAASPLLAAIMILLYSSIIVVSSLTVNDSTHGLRLRNIVLLL